jgi:hypothetical protein
MSAAVLLVVLLAAWSDDVPPIVAGIAWVAWWACVRLWGPQ